jgi:hypothetical protein
MDSAGCELIAVEAVPDLPEWTAIRDRLTRASAEGAEIPDVATGT